MTEAEYRVLARQQGSLIKYIRKHYSMIDYVAFSPKEECGYCVPRGVFVDCDLTTLWKLEDHVKRYYPKMLLCLMTDTVEKYAYNQLKIIKMLQR